jgi:Ca2+-transporting ATPase
MLFFGVVFAPVLGWTSPLLLPLNILFMNLVTDDLPAITLATNPSSADVMHEPPRKNAQIINRHFYGSVLLTGCIMALFALFSQYLNQNVRGLSAHGAQTATLFVLICLEIGNAFNFRPSHHKK